LFFFGENVIAAATLAAGVTIFTRINSFSVETIYMTTLTAERDDEVM